MPSSGGVNTLGPFLREAYAKGVEVRGSNCLALLETVIERQNELIGANVTFTETSGFRDAPLGWIFFNDAKVFVVRDFYRRNYEISVLDDLLIRVSTSEEGFSVVELANFSGTRRASFRV